MKRINYFEKLVSDLLHEVRKYGFAVTSNKNAANKVSELVDVAIDVSDGFYYLRKENAK